MQIVEEGHALLALLFRWRWSNITVKIQLLTQRIHHLIYLVVC